MLLGINLKNFAIIDDLTVSFGSGLNIITGETGAGKSIIVDAVNIILGDKASADIVKSDKKEAQIEALFDIKTNPALKYKLSSLGFEAEGDELVIKRIISNTGRSRIFINGGIATFTMLDQIADGLVDIFSQHEHQTLLREDKHINLLDEFGNLKSTVLEFGELYQRYKTAKKELEELEKNQREQSEKEEYLRFQAKEIDSASLRAGEDESLEEERKKLANAERLYSIAQECYKLLYEDENSALDILRKGLSEVKDGVRIDRTLTEAEKSIEKGIVEIEEAAFLLRDYASDVRSDPDKLNHIDNRLQEIRRLKKKYGGTVQDILDRREKIEKELQGISDYEGRVSSIKKDIDALEARTNLSSAELSKKRQDTAERLVSTIMRDLAEVGIKGGRLAVEFDKKEMSHNGYDKITFLFSANPDEKPRPLSKIASGGELSRIMLILKEALSRVEGGSVLIFDEADSGIGGAVAETVGQKIKKLSNAHQVICITHLAQVAKFADVHFKVTKTFKDDKTEVDAIPLTEEERVKEIARMLSGIKITEKTLEAAREMLKE